jgi:RHS repeat-associated protein
LSAFSYDSLGRVAQKLLHNNKNTIWYSYDMRNMLTETRNKHFSERLYYADSVFQVLHATHCYNGNIAASRITFRDSIFSFIYAYDAVNRLTSSKQPNPKGDIPCELLQYDAAGNITSLKRYQGHRKIDNLSYWYGEEGSQVISITDAENGLSKYATIEYHNSDTQADTIMRYDANGNLIVDIDRHINAIHYNILNLPDTIQFNNGNQIVNLYNAAGQKYKTIVYTVPVSTYVPQYEILHYTFNTEGISYSVTEYSGNIERHYVLGDTTLRIHNAIGYYVDNAYFHYIHDHLGNVCAVVQSDRDSVIQSTMYYASGVPMARSFGRDKQPYLYNGKEFVEAHEWNTYDYGFRGYYATIGRFTCVDPLAEQTPWLSPYAYAGNNFTNAIDWMGLGGMSSYNLTGVNSSGVVVYHDYSGDLRVFLVEDDWEEGDPVTNGLLVGWELWGLPYEVGTRCDYLCLGGGSIFSGEFGTGTPNTGKTYMFSTSLSDSRQISDDYNAFEGISGYVNLKNFMDGNPLMWQGAKGQYYNITQLSGQGQYCFRNSYKKAIIRGAKGPWCVLGTGLSAYSVYSAVDDMLNNGITFGNTTDAVVAGAGLYGGVAAWGLLGAGSLAAAPYVITVVTIYGVADFGVYLITDHSITDW